MSASDAPATGTAPEDFTRTWRYKVGLFLFIVGHLGLLVGLALPFLGAGAGLVGAMVVGGEVVGLISIVFLGKEGFKAIKSKIFASVGKGYAAPVGRTRHYIGVALLLANVVTTYTLIVYSWDAFAATGAGGPAAVVWGLDVAQQGSLVLWLFLIGEVSFLVSLYVLGADWWGRFRNIFVYQEPEGEGA